MVKTERLKASNPHLLLFSPQEVGSLDIALMLFGDLCHQLTKSLTRGQQKAVSFTVTYYSNSRKTEFSIDSEKDCLRFFINANKGNSEAEVWNIRKNPQQISTSFVSSDLPETWEGGNFERNIMRDFRAGFPTANVTMQHTTKGLKPITVITFTA